MTTTELIELLQKHEYGASGRPREITIYRSKKKGIQKVLDESEILVIDGTGDGIAGAELSLMVTE